MEISKDHVNTLLSQSTTPIQLAVYNNPLSNLAKDWTVIAQNPFLFNNEVTGDFKITDQKSSGRCWLFATLNLLRFIAGQTWVNEMDTKDLEFSQSYLFFWDKFERYHRNLRYFIDINNMDVDKKTQYFTNLCKDPLGDGGQWDMAKEVVKKYGVVPKKVYPDSFHAKNTGGMNMILTEQLKQDWVTLSKSDSSVHDTLIDSMMLRVYNMLVSYLGKPPSTFDFEFTYKSKPCVWKNLTPLELLAKTKFNPDDWISVVNDPRKENPYTKYYQVEYLGNVKDQHVGWLNIPMNRMKEMTMKSIRENQPVWFGCDVGAHRDRETGIHHPNIINFSNVLPYKVTMNKEERLRFYQSVPSHAMVITGFHQDTEKVSRWKVENSWGSSSGTNGYLLMTDDWFNEYVFQVVVHKSQLTDQEINEMNQVSHLIKPWDPLGTLA